MVSDLAKLRKTLREPSRSPKRLTGNMLPAFRQAQSRIKSELETKGRSEITDADGHRYVIERKRA